MTLQKHHHSQVNEMVQSYREEIADMLDRDYLKDTKIGDKIADKVAEFGGSWKFIGIFSLILFFWILLNSLALTKVIHFDPFPYILLNLCLSFVAAFQAPVIMMSQNRQAERDKREALIDFAINYKAEQEIQEIKEDIRIIKEKLLEEKQ